ELTTSVQRSIVSSSPNRAAGERPTSILKPAGKLYPPKLIHGFPEWSGLFGFGRCAPSRGSPGSIHLETQSRRKWHGYPRSHSNGSRPSRFAVKVFSSH